MLNTEWGLMVWTLITFGIALFILWKFAFGPIQKVIDERRADIQNSTDAAEETRAARRAGSWNPRCGRPASSCSGR